MSIATKSPAMVLNEVTVKIGYGPPLYELILGIGGTHNNKFEYKVTVDNVEAIGEGTSKQMAKQNAAHKALMKLSEKGMYNPAEMPVNDFNKVVITPSASGRPVIVDTTSTAQLKELCTENKIKLPSFTLTSDVGPPHLKEFTFECKIGPFITVGKGNTKKMAKHASAQEMMENMKANLPEFVLQCTVSEEEALPDDCIHDSAVQKYNQIFGRKVVDESVKMVDYSSAISNLMKKYDKTIDDFRKDLQEGTEESLVNILDKLELTYVRHKIQDNPVAISVTLSTNTPFTTIGVDDDAETAYRKALSYVFEILNIFMIL